LIDIDVVKLNAQSFEQNLKIRVYTLHTSEKVSAIT